MMQELRRHGYELGPGTVYPVLLELECLGYLARQDRVVRGKVRKYYTATPAGIAALAEARQKMAELVGEVLEGRGPTTLPDPAEADLEADLDP
jgi:PadR family transcriptional regulator